MKLTRYIATAVAIINMIAVADVAALLRAIFARPRRRAAPFNSDEIVSRLSKDRLLSGAKRPHASAAIAGRSPPGGMHVFSIANVCRSKAKGRPDQSERQGR